MHHMEGGRAWDMRGDTHLAGLGGGGELLLPELVVLLTLLQERLGDLDRLRPRRSVRSRS
jgi:hypothetical protein